MIRPESNRSRLLMWGLLFVLGLVLLLGGWLLVVMLMGPQSIELVVSEPVGADVYYDVVLDGAASAGVATVPTTLRFQGRRLAFAVIPKSETTADLKVELKTRQSGDVRQRGPGVVGSYDSSGSSTNLSIGLMTSAHIANMRGARTAENATSAE